MDKKTCSVTTVQTKMNLNVLGNYKLETFLKRDSIIFKGMPSKKMCTYPSGWSRLVG